MATVLIHPWKFGLCWLWQRVMSGSEDFSDIWGISGHFSPQKVSYKQKKKDYIKKILVSAALLLS